MKLRGNLRYTHTDRCRQAGSRSSRSGPSRLHLSTFVHKKPAQRQQIFQNWLNSLDIYSDHEGWRMLSISHSLADNSAAKNTFHPPKFLKPLKRREKKKDSELLQLYFSVGIERRKGARWCYTAFSRSHEKAVSGQAGIWSLWLLVLLRTLFPSESRTILITNRNPLLGFKPQLVPCLSGILEIYINILSSCVAQALYLSSKDKWEKKPHTLIPDRIYPKI